MNAATFISSQPLAACQTMPAAKQPMQPDWDVQTSLRGRFCQRNLCATDMTDVKEARGDADFTATRDSSIQGARFARHLRTKVEEESGVWRAYAVYTHSPALLRGARSMDTGVVVVNPCREENSDGVRTNG